jgi:hypothetical protein
MLARMRIRSAPLISLLVISAAGCAPAEPPPPVLVAAGWSWDPAVAGTRPLPVTGTAGKPPVVLPLLPGGDCAASGTVQAMAVSPSRTPVAAGMSVSCSGDLSVMQPVAWADGTLVPLPLPAGVAQGTALSLSFADVSGEQRVYVGGAVGDTSPIPMIWMNGSLGFTDLGRMLPPFADAGIVTSVVANERFVLAGGIVHVPTGGTMPWQAVAWLLDVDLTDANATALTAPIGAHPTGYGPWVSIAYDTGAELAWAASGADAGAGTDKPFVWVGDGVSSLIEPLDFSQGPFGSPTGLVPLGVTPYVSGWQTAGTQDRRIVPVLWAGTVAAPLPMPNASGGWGAAEGLDVAGSWAYVVGETTYANPANTRQVVAAPALWANGQLHGLPALSSPEFAGATLTEPFFGWWRLPGTPATSPPDWPLPGGMARLVDGGLPIAAAGSAVARVIVAVPQQ